MGEYDRKQRNQLSRIIANSESRNRQLKEFADGRKKISINFGSVRTPLYKNVLKSNRKVYQAMWNWWNSGSKGDWNYYLCDDYPKTDFWEKETNCIRPIHMSENTVDATETHMTGYTKFGTTHLYGTTYIGAPEIKDSVTKILTDGRSDFNLECASGTHPLIKTASRGADDSFSERPKKPNLFFGKAPTP